MINLMNTRALIASLAIAASAVAMTALAQVDIASTTPPAEVATTTTDQVIAPEPATTPIIESGATTSTSTPEVVSTSTPSVQVPPTATPQVDVVATPSAINVQAITALQDSYFAKAHRYLQIVPGNKLPDYETGTVAQRLGADMPAGARVDVYESPKGFGYQIIYDENGTTYSVGFGPEAEDRTYSHPIPPAAVASSTEQIAQ